MNIIHKVTWKSMWKNRTRTLVTIVSVMLSAAMFMAVVTLVYSLADYIMETYTYRSGDYYVEFRYSSDEQYEALKADPDVEHQNVLGTQLYAKAAALAAIPLECEMNRHTQVSFTQNLFGYSHGFFI